MALNKNFWLHKIRDVMNLNDRNWAKCWNSKQTNKSNDRNLSIISVFFECETRGEKTSRRRPKDRRNHVTTDGRRASFGRTSFWPVFARKRSKSHGSHEEVSEKWISRFLLHVNENQVSKATWSVLPNKVQCHYKRKVQQSNQTYWKEGVEKQKFTLTKKCPEINDYLLTLHCCDYFTEISSKNYKTNRFTLTKNETLSATHIFFRQINLRVKFIFTEIFRQNVITAVKPHICGNHGILLPRFFSQKFRQINVLLNNFTINWFDGKILHGREFFLFPHCEKFTLTEKKFVKPTF